MGKIEIDRTFALACLCLDDLLMPSLETAKRGSPYLPAPSKDARSVALRQLHCSWQFLELCQLLWILQSSLKLKSFTLSDMEAALVDSGAEPAHGILDEVVSKLLLKSHHRARLGVGEGLPATWWNEKLQVVVAKWFTELQKLSAARTDEPLEWDDEQQERLQVLTDRVAMLSTSKLKDSSTPVVSPLTGQCFRQLGVVPKVQLLRAVISWCLEDQRDAQLLSAIRDLEHDDLRTEDAGRDTAGNRYFYFPQFFKDARLYRQRPAGKSTVPNKQPPPPRFELWVDGPDSFKRFFDELKTQKKKCDRDLYENLEEVMELITQEHAAQLKRVAREKEEKERQAKVLAGSMRRSGRVATVELQKSEQHQQESEILQQARLATLELKSFTEADISSSDSDRDQESDQEEDDEEEQRLHRQKLARKRQDELEKKRKLELEQEREEQDKKRKLEQGADRERRAKLRVRASSDSEEDAAGNTQIEQRKPAPKRTIAQINALGPEITSQYADAGDWKVYADSLPSKASKGFKVYVSPSGVRLATMRGAREAGFEGEPGAA